MPTIRATFDNADSAEWALCNLRRTGVPVNASKLVPARSGSGRHGLFPYRFHNGFGPADYTLGNYAPGPFDDTGARRVYDTRSAEVVLEVEVPPEAASRAQSYLVSRHATQVGPASFR